MIPTLNNRPVSEIFSFLGARPSYENFMVFVKTFLEPHMISPFIEEDYYKTLWDDMWHNRHCLMQLPRGHSKTEFVGIWMTIYLACCQPINPFFNKYNKHIQSQLIIAGDTDAKHAWSERIKHFFYENPLLKWLIPEGVDSKRQNNYWNDRVMYFKNGHQIIIRAISEKAIRGNHVDRLHADDLVTENSTMVDQAIKDKWDGAVDGTTTNKRAMVQVTGTPLRYSDILFHLKSRQYYFRRLPAILDYENKVILSPKRWNWENLMETKMRIGSLKFQSEYMLDPIDDSTSLIKSQWIRQCFSIDKPILHNRNDMFKAIYLGVDFAFSDRITADSSAFVIVGELHEKDELTKQTRKVYYICDMIKKKGMSALEQFEFIKQLHTTYKFNMIGVEENSIKSIGKHLSSFNLPLKRYWTSTKDSRNQAELKDYETIGKRNLIIRIGNMFEQKNMIVPYNTIEARDKAEGLYNELITFATEEDELVEIGVHSDLGIALGYALEAAGRPNIVVSSLAWMAPKDPKSNAMKIPNSLTQSNQLVK